ncbi:trypsin-like serine peptidase [Pseudobacteriovorax antillogorgiicola]|uniref:V8-like Glu-specific endopeptidase n=1 Tax=Pseudobacteriovorax antillogorgiicola TaxID=1513793 RepID=A0A1Y6C4A4_9BACT|nr:serine protease [Pseudobacteriovorax antillogorgiicola]TCS51262.1 V8-like Glu-specific endopeptidase [Pseudobacteriovorax antillogorgiicola]SMF36422.1 V8-like Glu-specific endopeptidase [Pseudobacteriovorax antillogorgiicola]
MSIKRKIWPFLSLLTISCMESSPSLLNNIYREDQSGLPSGNERRHDADQSELSWTVRNGSCSATLLNPQYLLTAAHCRPAVGELYTSGLAVGAGEENDIEVDEVLELNQDLDYTIARIRWPAGGPREGQQYPAYVATTVSDLWIDDRSNQGDLIFTVGFPDDKRSVWKATYAQGRAKRLAEGSLYYNIGVINGNSGGGIIKAENQMLIAVVKGGPSKFGTSDWDRSSKDQSQAWNFGTPAWLIYEASPLLRSLFPDGKNRSYEQEFKARSKIYVAVDEDGSDGFYLMASASLETQGLRACSGPDCDRVLAFEAIDGPAGRTFFRSKQRLVGSSFDLTLQAFNQGGEKIGERRIGVQK